MRVRLRCYALCLDLLSRQQLWGVAAEIIRECPLEEIRKRNLVRSIYCYVEWMSKPQTGSNSWQRIVCTFLCRSPLHTTLHVATATRTWRVGGGSVTDVTSSLAGVLCGKSCDVSSSLCARGNT